MHDTARKATATALLRPPNCSQPRRSAAAATAGPRKRVQHRCLACSLSAEAEQRDVMWGGAWQAAGGAGKVCKDAAEDGGKLEAVPGAGAAQHDLQGWQ